MSQQVYEIQHRRDCFNLFYIKYMSDKSNTVPVCITVGFDHGLPCRVKNMARGTQAEGRGFCRYWGPRAMFSTRHGRPWSNSIIARSLIDFFPYFIRINMNFSALKGAFFAHFMVVKEIALLLWTGCQGTQINNCHENLDTSFTGLNLHLVE